MSKKIKLHLLITIFWYFITLLVIFGSFTFMNELKIDILQYQLLFTTLLVLYSATRFVKISHLYIIFIGMNIVFLFNRIFLDLFGLYDFSMTYFPIVWQLSISTQETLLIVFITALLSLHIGFLFSLKRKVILTTLRFNPFYYKIGLILFIGSIVPLLYKLYLKLQIISIHGYTSYNTIANDMIYPSFTKGSESLFLLGFSFLVVSMPPLRKFKVIVFIYLFVGLLSASTGVRALFVVKIVYVFWLYYAIYSKKDIKKLTLALIIVSIMIFSQAMVAYRTKANFDTQNILLKFISQQGVSMSVLGYMVEFEDNFKRKGYPYILHPIVATFIPNQGQNAEYTEKYNMLSRNITYFLNSKAYLNGAGLGSSYIAELYDLGYLLMYILLIVLGFGVGKLHNIVLSSRIWLFMSPLLISQIIYMSRTNLLPRFREVLFYLFVLMIVIMIQKNYGKNEKII